jgi:sortase (surface protein transpeptidase)
MGRQAQGGGRWHFIVSATAVALVALGLVVVLIAATRQHHAPQPSASAAVPLTLSQSPSAASEARQMAPSKPLSLSIPAIGVSHSLSTVGLNADHTIQVPSLTDVSIPAWYRLSPTPGTIGTMPAVIVGHVDSAVQGQGVFFNLGAVKQGAQIKITRADHTVAVFTVTAVASYAKSNFPTQKVYGKTTNPQLRIITCGGDFDSSKHSYVSNIVVYASLTSSYIA